MKIKIFFVGFIFCFAWQANAQTEFAPIGAEWYYNYGGGPIGGCNHIVAEKDTVVEGNNCRVLRLYSDRKYGITKPEQYIIKPEQDKVYYYYQDRFHLLFDFDAEVNDIVEFTFMYRKYDYENEDLHSYKDTIFSVRCEVENIATNDQNLKTFQTKVLDTEKFAFDANTVGCLPNNPFENHIYSYTERLGFYKDFMPVLDNLGEFPAMDMFSFLRCYSDADISFISDMWATIDSWYPSYVGIVTPVPCNYPWHTGLNMSKDAENVKIYPNPFNDNISVSMNNDGEIKIMDISGSIIYHSKLLRGINELSTNHFPKGIFFVEIKNNDNRIQTIKIVKP